MNKPKKRIAVMTSGGDSPGMNAAVRSIVRKGVNAGLAVFGVQRGYEGLIDGEFIEMGPRSVSDIIHRGGTLLKTARSQRFRTEEGREKAKEKLEKLCINGFLIIGGDGSFHGAHKLSKIWDGQVIGLPGTIDNDLYGTDLTIGFDTAVNTALYAIDHLRDTAEAHERFFIIELMGRHAGFISLMAAVSGGAEEVLIPETKTDLEAIARRMEAGLKRGKKSCMIVVAEGDECGGAYAAAQRLHELTGRDYKVCILGHVQRGGSPTSVDRVLASKLGGFAVDAFLEGHTDVMVGEVNGQCCFTPLKETWEKKKKLDSYLLDLAAVLAT
ncbi:MAG: 6-phosphofructokinase [Candidatus Theseobacter exili]|nr:6-phosphofructokinase [Candidatus Theseobacter exili]